MLSVSLHFAASKKSRTREGLRRVLAKVFHGLSTLGISSRLPVVVILPLLSISIVLPDCFEYSIPLNSHIMLLGMMGAGGNQAFRGHVPTDTT